MIYRVVWEIDIDADTAIDAARKALEIQRDLKSDALFFTVEQEDAGVEIEVDLLDEETEAHERDLKEEGEKYDGHRCGRCGLPDDPHDRLECRCVEPAKEGDTE